MYSVYRTRMFYLHASCACIEYIIHVFVRSVRTVRIKPFQSACSWQHGHIGLAHTAAIFAVSLTSSMCLC